MGTVAVAVVEPGSVSMWDTYEVGMACAVFGVDHSDLVDPWYELWLCGPEPDASGNAAGLVLHPDHGLDAVAAADTVIVPGVPEECMDGTREVPPELTTALVRAHRAGARIASLCNGAFALAAAGLLDGRRATAHWVHVPLLAQRYPEIEVDDSVLYVEDGTVLTSAGLSAGMDLCLHLVRLDLGAHVANELARHLVMPPHRPGGQAQFVPSPMAEPRDSSLTPALQWALRRLHEPITVADLARQAGLSVRTLHRRLRDTTGSTPLQWLLTQRIARAQSLLETTRLSVEQVAQRSGLGTGNTLRYQFARHVGVSPTEHRRAFQGTR
nr:helix-turn-helix domain-containing protein [Lipingzhangella rawalii]